MYNQLKEFQKRAVRDLVDKCSELLDKPGSQKVCVFCSPTGSGKTLMSSRVIEGLIKRREDELSFIWVTIGKGDLHIQTNNALKRLFNGTPRVSLLEEEFFGSRNEIGPGEVVVVNWNKLYNKDGQTGEWKNILMKDGEKINFREVLANTRAKRNIC